MATNVGSIRFTIGQRPNRARPQTLKALDAHNDFVLPEEIDGDEYTFTVGPRTRLIRLSGVRRVRFAMRPHLDIPDTGPADLLVELPDLEEALALIVNAMALHAPKLELLGLLIATRLYLRHLDLSALSYLHQAHIVAPALEAVHLGPGSSDALLNVCAPPTVTVSAYAPLTMVLRDERIGTTVVNVWQARRAGTRLALLEVMHWFTPRAYREDEATYDADNLVFELGPEDDVLAMGRRALTLHIGQDTKPYAASVRVLADDTVVRWVVVPRAVILAKEPSSAPISIGGSFERIDDPGPDAAMSWVAQVGSLGRLLEAPAARPAQRALSTAPPPEPPPAPLPWLLSTEILPVVGADARPKGADARPKGADARPKGADARPNPPPPPPPAPTVPPTAITVAVFCCDHTDVALFQGAERVAFVTIEVLTDLIDERFTHLVVVGGPPAVYHEVEALLAQRSTPMPVVVIDGPPRLSLRHDGLRRIALEGRLRTALLQALARPIVQTGVDRR